VFTNRKEIGQIVLLTKTKNCLQEIAIYKTESHIYLGKTLLIRPWYYQQLLALRCTMVRRGLNYITASTLRHVQNWV